MFRYKFKICLLFAFLINAGFSFTQNLDSLKLLLPKCKEDTIKLQILITLAENEPDENEWPKYNEELYTLSKKLIQSNSEEVKLYAKDCLALALGNKGFLCGSKGDLPGALENYENSIKIMKEVGNTKGIGDSYNAMGFLCYNQGKIIQAFDFFGRGLELRQKIGDKKGMAQSLNNIAIVYQSYGEIDKSLDYNLRALKIQEEIGDKYGIANSFNSIGYIYNLQHDYQKCLEYYDKCLKLKEEIDDKIGISLSLNNIGMIFSIQRDPNKALDYYERSLKISEEINNKRGMANSFVNIGAIYFSKNDFDKALSYYQKSLKIELELNNKEGIAEAYIDMAGSYLQSKKHKLAAEFANNSLILSKELGFVEKIRNAERMLSKADSADGNYKGAFEHYRQFVIYRDSLSNEATRKSSLKSQFQVEFNRKERDVKLKAEADRQLMEQINADEQKQKNIIIYSVLFGLLLVIVFSGFLFKSLSKNKKANVIITRQKQEVEQSKKEIVDSINYAKRIQYALLASDNLLNANLPEHFVLFKPKDVVSGDFYWATPTPDGFIYITADCTGHGVPGAFMSLLNISKLSQAINENKIVQPNLILNNVRAEITKALNPEGTIEESKDGMDAILCKLNVKKMKLEYAAANNSFFIVRENSVIICKADKMPVGKGHDDSKLFSHNEFGLQKGDIIYTFTDGFADQFGGPNGKKFKRKQLEEKLLSIHKEPMQKQREILLENFRDWKGDLEQVDDMLVIGVRIS